MTDLEITRSCAEAMGHEMGGVMSLADPERVYAKNAEGFNDGTYSLYNPLHDDAQAMALVKKFNLWISAPHGLCNWWSVSSDESWAEYAQDLNRAICECVAKMQLAKASAT